MRGHENKMVGRHILYLVSFNRCYSSRVKYKVIRCLRMVRVNICTRGNLFSLFLMCLCACLLEFVFVVTVLTSVISNIDQVDMSILPLLDFLLSLTLDS